MKRKNSKIVEKMSIIYKKRQKKDFLKFVFRELLCVIITNDSKTLLRFLYKVTLRDPHFV